jgi:hypothetical protein
MWEQCLKRVYVRFLPHPFEFLIKCQPIVRDYGTFLKRLPSFHISQVYNAPKSSCWQRCFTVFLRLGISAWSTRYTFPGVLASPYWQLPSYCWSRPQPFHIFLTCNSDFAFLHINLFLNWRQIVPVPVCKNPSIKIESSFTEYAILITAASLNYHQRHHFLPRLQKHIQLCLLYTRR